MSAVASVAELYAHAIAIEREATERYLEFAWRMEDLGNRAVAGVFAQLARFEAEHLQALLARTRDLALPQVAPGAYAWLDAGAPETAVRELVFGRMTPRAALAIALGAERRAQAFFERVLRNTADPALRALAREMAADEGEHIRILQAMLETPRELVVDWVSLYRDETSIGP